MVKIVKMTMLYVIILVFYKMPGRATNIWLIMIITTSANGYTVAYATCGAPLSVRDSAELSPGVDVIPPVMAPISVKKFIFIT